jgi:hypothetical protein
MFLSDTDPAYHYLEILQKQAKAHRFGAFQWTNDDNQRDALRSL